ncbi:MAG: hypothetical protein LBE24_00685 [Methylobacillus sp.]|jgi:tetratricopeptide (TPR) repeat protein|nr:hypothetical protein [Methylobacillus sp.]
MTLSMDEIHAKARHKAAEAVMALANRTESKGRAEIEPGKKPKPGWIVADNLGMEMLVHPEKLREAIIYYEIASSIDPKSAGDYAIYNKALLLEILGDFAEAEKTFLEIGYGGNQATKMHVDRCRAKQQGTFYPMAYVMDGMKAMMKPSGMDTSFMEKMFDKNSSAEQLLGHANEWLGQLMEQSKAAGEDTSALELVSAMINSPPDNEDADAEDIRERELDEQTEEQITELAQQFADLLLDKKYAEAKTILHSSLAKITARDLKDSFEQLFEGDEHFPDTATVFSVDRVLSDRPDDDLAHVYVTIDSENAEAVSFIVTREGGKLTLRELEWGRP